MTVGTGSTINVIDLFAGCGGFTQGFHEFKIDGVSPFRTVGAVEWDYAAASTYAANFAAEAGGTDHIFAGDIKDWDPSVIDVDVDVILGGPPCQGFSGLGKEDAADPRNKLWREYVRVVQSFNPKVFVIENVDRFLTKSTEYDALVDLTERPDGELRDYRLERKVLNAADYGVPQARRRAIILATRRDLIERHPEQKPMLHPARTHRKREKTESDTAMLVSLEEIFPSWVPAGTVFETVTTPPMTTMLPDRTCSPLRGKTLPGRFRTMDLHIGRTPTLLSLARYAAIPPGGNRHDLPSELSTPNWIGHRKGSGDVMGRMYWDQPSVTIRTEFYKPEKGRYLHPFEDRPITHLEAALIQGFPRDFLWCGSKIQIARQIGNAVPVGLSRAIAGQVFGYLAVTGQQRTVSMRESA
jgi:DNA (cytosine-5)-methyltransferase 1